MIKIIFVLALLSSTLFCASYAQQTNDLSDNNDFSDDIDSAVEEFLSEAIIFSETELESSFIIGEYEWTLFNNNEGEIELSVDSIAASIATDLEGALTDLLVSIGEAIENRADEIESELDGLIGAEEDVMEIQQENNATAANIRRFGNELQANASQLSATLVKNYNIAASDYSNNVDHVTDKLNQALNTLQNSESAETKREAVLGAIADIINAGNIASNQDSETAPITSEDLESINTEIESILENQDANRNATVVVVNSTNLRGPSV